MTSLTIHEKPLDDLARFVEEEAARAIEARGAFSIALPGGSVATEGFPLLARASVDWARVDFLWGDERAVPPDHADSNYGVAKRLLLDAVRAPADRVHRMVAEAPDRAASARLYEATARRIGIDLAVLGVGPDGHVCSLFPGHPLLGEETRWVAAIDDSPKPPPARLTLTLPCLAAAGAVVIVALGSAKAEVVRAAFEDPECSLPLALVLRRAARAQLLVDPAAGALLSQG